MAQEQIGAVSTTFRLMSPNDKVVIERYDDPKVENVSCYLSRAETGGWSGAMGLAEDPQPLLDRPPCRRPGDDEGQGPR